MKTARTLAAALLPVLFAATGAFAQALPEDPMKLDLHGAGWVQFGRVERSQVGVDLSNNYNKNWMQSGGAQLGVTAKFDESWEGGLALGVVEVHLPRGARSDAGLWFPFWVPYVGEARVTYTRTGESTKLRITAGNFGYGYNPDAKNLGMYLTRGYLYPGTLESGFGGIFGVLASVEEGGFRNDLILKSEDQKPLYDGSIIDAASYRVTEGFELGAGVNFYRVFRHNSNLTSPGQGCGGLSYGTCSYVDYSDTAGGNPPDTVTGSLSGTKLMARFSLDPKLLLGFSSVGGLAFGKADLKLYGETALLGTQDYPIFYDDMARRMPVMMGFNFPAFGLLDYLSVETEYYASRNSSDTRGAAFGGGWVPWQSDTDLEDYNDRDNWKWSVNAARTLFGSMQLSGQVANDHLRLGGTHDIPWIGREALRTPKDWYWTCKLAYFF
ncbi:MAG TPA: hypothetical protein VHO02_02525 [Fibrobacteria bacterium]|jgi:hypothetical protein|nr:hypothetical protein [Fibrobacteria bacterium]